MKFTRPKSRERHPPYGIRSSTELRKVLRTARYSVFKDRDESCESLFRAHEKALIKMTKVLEGEAVQRQMRSDPQAGRVFYGGPAGRQEAKDRYHRGDNIFQTTRIRAKRRFPALTR